MTKLFHGIASFLIRISSFISKEFFSVISQPRLVGVLVVGPFLILLLFGISYRNIYQTLRMILVYPENSPIESSVQAFSEMSVAGLQVVDVTTNASGALASLKDQQVDLVMIIPQGTLREFEANRQGVFTFYHQEIDPMEATYASIVANRITEEVNRQLLLSTVKQSKQAAQNLLLDIYEARQTDPTDLLESSSDPGTGVSSIGPEAVVWLLLQAVGKQSAGLAAANPGSLQSESGMEFASADAEELLIRFIEANPDLIVKPFRQETQRLGAVDIQPVHFYVPAVLALLLQHIALSLAGLSIVSERFAGTMELMRAAPVNAFEVLLGKYVSLTLLIGVVTAVLTALVLWILGVPLSGSLGLYALVTLLVVLASLGFGFLISNFANSVSQAIQFSMVVLLASIFFSGFLIPLYRLSWPAQAVSWAMPVTYGAQMLQDIMLLGTRPDTWLFAVLAGIAAILFLVNWLRLRHVMVQN